MALDTAAAAPTPAVDPTMFPNARNVPDAAPTPAAAATDWFIERRTPEAAPTPAAAATDCAVALNAPDAAPTPAATATADTMTAAPTEGSSPSARRPSASKPIIRMCLKQKQP